MKYSFRQANKSQTDLDAIFAKFKEKFPPAKSLPDSSVKLSTDEFWEIVTKLDPSMKNPKDGFFTFLVNQGYRYEPMEEYGLICFKWLIKRL